MENQGFFALETQPAKNNSILATTYVVRRASNRYLKVVAGVGLSGEPFSSGGGVGPL